MDPCSPAASCSSTLGLALYGASASLIILSALGNDPWDVLHQGLSRQTGIGTGIWVCIAGALVLLLWIPLRQRPGLGTLSNVVVVGLVLELCSWPSSPRRRCRAPDAVAVRPCCSTASRPGSTSARASGPARATG